MTVTHVGSSKKYVAGWDHIFGGGKQSARKQSAKRKSAAKPKRGKKK